MPRIVHIPPAVLPASSAPGDGPEPSWAGLSITLVDRSGQPVPASDVLNGALYAGEKRGILTDTAVALSLATQAEVNGESFYLVSVRQGSATWTKTVQVPAGDGSDLTWAEFTGASAPVAPPVTRLLPDPVLLADGVVPMVADGAWVTGRLNLAGAPSAPDGLAPGEIWIDGNVVKVAQ